MKRKEHDEYYEINVSEVVNEKPALPKYVRKYV